VLCWIYGCYLSIQPRDGEVEGVLLPTLPFPLIVFPDADIGRNTVDVKHLCEASSHLRVRDISHWVFTEHKDPLHIPGFQELLLKPFLLRLRELVGVQEDKVYPSELE
jgi:hypothetical protein